MENQHRKIKGYRELNETDIKHMNAIKEKAKEVGELLDELMNTDIDPRWLAIAKTNLQQGFMAATRAVAQPEFF